MASPIPYDDTRFGLPGSPDLYGDMAGLRGSPTSTLRHRQPSESRLHRIHLYLVIAACHEANLSPKIVAEITEISVRHVRRIYAAKTKANRRRNP